ncbi:O-antigen ligase family protein [Donghicola sp. C2-DW-16]|uniref:O-antigen ligase family protein n=1 Tax=Donghicola mangrovi TaxID=2729614 RepID=A0ABX2PB18_9RHOB|nr:O-antigen ligase family protein [Donghicola mangrovi]NVO26670.1 O-antigen ligase family protein [Donghicola mangrovi]
MNPAPNKAMTDLKIGIAAGVTSGLIALAFAIAGHVKLAVIMPVAAVFGLGFAAHPFVGVSALLFFAQLDGIQDKIFPGDGFKLMTLGTMLGVIVTAFRHRGMVKDALMQPIAIMGMLLGVSMLVSALGADSKVMAANSLRRLLAMIIFMYLIIIMVNTRARFEKALMILALTSLISGIILILDVKLGMTLISTSDAATTARTAEGFERSSGASQYNPTTAATMMLTGVIIALVMFLEQDKYKRFYLAAAGIGTMALIFSFARSSFIVYTVTGMFLAYRYRKHHMIVPAMVIGSMLVLIMLPFLPESYYERIGSIFGAGGGDWTLGRRMTYNVIGVNLLVEHPLFGVGPGNFKKHFVDSAYRFLPGRTMFGRQLHNMHLSIMVEYGLVGATFFYAMVISAFKGAFRVMREPVDANIGFLATAYMYGLMSYMMVSVFVPNEYNKYTWIMLGLGAALPRVNRKDVA